VLAWGLLSLIRKLPAVIIPLAGLGLDPAAAGLLLLIGVCIGLLSALIPAWGAARTPILRALRVTD
jgi:ABC-type lipoprotein release transport system permease subunit